MTLEIPIRKTVKAEQWPQQGMWRYEDYARLPNQEVKYEVIGGNLYMSPAPRPSHQYAVAMILSALIAFVEKHNLGKVFPAPIDVNMLELATPVQPDLLFIRHDNAGIIKERLIDGVPDLIVEVLSPSNPWHDRRTKFELYAQAGVTEYWMVDVEQRIVEVYVLRGRAYVPRGIFGEDDMASSELLDGFAIGVRKICL